MAMISPAGAEGAESLGDSPPLAAAGDYPTAAAGFDRGLVVLASGRPYWLVPADGAYRLLVEAADVDAVREELAKFERESARWPPPPNSLTPPGGGSARAAAFAALIWAALVVGGFVAEGIWPDRLEARGAVDAQAIFQRGEWWRLVTALFLHADAGHLLSNLVSGYFVLFAVLVALGLVRGGLLLAAAAVLGNGVVAAIFYPGPYASLGASTGIFAGLGLLTGRAVHASLGRGRPTHWAAVLLPLGSGLTLLGLYGAGEARTDVAAHAAGFIVGALLATFDGYLRRAGGFGSRP